MQATDLGVHRVALARVGDLVAPADDPAEAVVGRHLPLDGHGLGRHPASADEGIGREPGPQHDPVRDRVAGRHPERERRRGHGRTVADRGGLPGSGPGGGGAETGGRDGEAGGGASGQLEEGASIHDGRVCGADLIVRWSERDAGMMAA